MSGPLHSLSDAASNIACRIPELLRHLRDLESEEAELNAKARGLIEQLPGTMDRPLTSSRPSVATPVVKRRRRAAADRGTPGTPLRINPRNIETPVRTFLLMESFELAMSIKTKRKGRIFLAGGTTELGEKRQS